MNTSVLITGGTGYLGSRIVQHLARDPKFDLSVLTHRESPIQRECFPSVRTVAGDLCDESALESACKNIDCIVHLAALNEIDCAAQPEQAMMVNGIGTMKLLNAARASGVEKFIYFSTAHVYGAPLTGTLSEECLPRPIHPYAVSHRTAEDFVLAAHSQQQLTGIVLRLSNALGAPAHATIQRWTLIGNDLCRQAILHHRLVLRSSGQQRRDFIPLSDVARAVNHFINLPPAACGDGLFNLGGDCPMRIVDLARKIADRCNIVLGFKPDLIIGGDGSPEPESFLDYQIKKLKETGFVPQGDLDSEIDDTLKLCASAFGKSNG